MSENKETTAINPANYGYAADSKVPISGELFQRLLNVLTTLNHEEVKVYFEDKETEDEFFNQEPKIFRTEKGYALTKLLGEFFYLHEENIKSGIAKTFEELQKPKLELVK
jgi:hypothetical protein